MHTSPSFALNSFGVARTRLRHWIQWWQFEQWPRILTMMNRQDKWCAGFITWHQSLTAMGRLCLKMPEERRESAIPLVSIVGGKVRSCWTALICWPKLECLYHITAERSNHRRVQHLFLNAFYDVRHTIIGCFSGWGHEMEDANWHK